MQSSSNNNLFKQRRSYNPITDPDLKEKVRVRNLEWNTKNPTKKHEGQKRWRNKNPNYNHEYRNRKHIEKFGVPLPPKTNVSKFEQTWTTIINLEFPEFSFVKIRPSWIENPDTKYNLELDMFCFELQIAIEISGDQHLRFIPKFHRDYDNFLYQQKKDKFKANQCNKLGIYLIVVDKNSKPSRVIELIKCHIIKHETNRIQSFISNRRRRSI